MDKRSILAKALVIVASLFVLFTKCVPAQEIDYCEGNFDYDYDCDGSDAALFKQDFGRGEYNNPCPPDGPSPVPKTGQTLCYDEIDPDPIPCTGTGQDGDLQRGVAWPNPRFTDNGDGTVTDNLTGLIWLRDANCSLFDAPRHWEDALNLIVPQLEDGYCGLTDGSSAGDWRLPNKKELISITHDGCYQPAVPNITGTGCGSEGDPFNNVQSSSYWSSTTNASIPHYAWYVHMSNGGVFNYSKANSYYYVWPVRGGR